MSNLVERINYFLVFLKMIRHRWPSATDLHVPLNIDSNTAQSWKEDFYFRKGSEGGLSLALSLNTVNAVFTAAMFN